jgi:YD repeat-containing protein
MDWQKMSIQNQQFADQFGEGQREFNVTTGLKQQELGEDTRQFDQTYALDQQKVALQTEIDRGNLQLQQLQEQHDTALRQGQLDLAREIQTKQQALAETQAANENRLRTADQSGFMDNGQLTEAARQARAGEAYQQQQLALQDKIQTGQLTLAQAQAMGYDAQGNLTEAARAARVNEGLQNTQTMGYDANGNLTLQGRQQGLDEVYRNTGMMGVDANGNLTDASQQWRTSAGLQAAGMLAQAQMRPDDYFLAAALQRNGDVQNNLGFLNAAGAGSSMGFHSAATSLPQTGTIPGLSAPNAQQNVPGAGQASGPSPSVAASQAAAAGQPAAFTTQTHDPAQAAFANAQQGMPMDPAAQRLAAMQPTIMAGAHKLAPGSMEAMSATEKGLFTSGLKASGMSPDDWDQQYKRSRLQTGVSALAA